MSKKQIFFCGNCTKPFIFVSNAFLTRIYCKRFHFNCLLLFYDTDLFPSVDISLFWIYTEKSNRKLIEKETSV